MASKGKIALGTVIGAVAGFVAGVLIAPKSGRETREDLKNKAVEKKNEAVAKGKEYRGKAGDVAEDVVTKAEKVAGDTADNVVSATEKAANVVIGTTKDLKSKSQTVAKNAKSAIQKNK